MAKSRSLFIKWAVCIILPIIILAAPTTATYTMEIKNFLAITVFLIALFAADILSAPCVALLMPVSYVILLGVAPGAAFVAWTQPIPWMVLGSFILSYSLEKTGLLRRIALRCVSLIGGSYVGIVVGIVLAGGIVSLAITDISAKAVLFGTFALSVCKVLNFELGSRASAGLAVAVLIAILDPGTLFLHGSTNMIVPLSIAAEAGMTHPTWMEFLYHMFVPHIIFIALCTIALLIIFKPDADTKAKMKTAREGLAGELKAVGPLKMDEIKLIVICALMLIGILTTGKLHDIHLGWIFLLAGIALLLPGVKLVTPPELAKCNLPFVIVIAAFLSMGAVSNSVGFGPFMSELAEPFITGSMHHIYAGVFIFGFVINLILTPLAAYSAFTAPVVMIAENLGVNPLPIVYTWSMTFEQIIFPFQFVPVLIIFGYGMISFKDMVKFNIIKSIISFACIMTVYMGWWYMIGIL